MASKSSKAGATGHTAGIFADNTLDGPEIGTLVVVVDRAKNLPNRKTMGKQDPYCAMRLGKHAKKTDTDRRGGQTPRWDQEIRFTVHDSPDYYKLKVSCFNDDKRTDLIGEAFISLADLIKPGGGSNDLWHQLSYKGKYAGDIRMEMTYYDMRPREEKTVEKRRHREKAESGFGDASNSTAGVSGPRQLGPREVRRRPLPTSPGQTPPMTEMQQQHPEPRQHPHHAENAWDPHEMYQMYPTQASSHAGSTYENYQHEHLPLQPINPEQFRNSSQSYPESQDMLDMSQRRRSFVPQAMEHADHHDYPSQYQEHSSVPPIEADRAYGVPLVETIPHHDNVRPHPTTVLGQPIAYDQEDDMDDAPPPPPKHQHPPRRSQPDYPPSSFVPKTIRPTPIRPHIEERSPLQHIEHTYSTHAPALLQKQNEVMAPLTYGTSPHQPVSSFKRRSSHGTYAQQFVDEPVAMVPSQTYPPQFQTNSYPPTALVPSDALGYESTEIPLAAPHSRRNSFNPYQQTFSDRQMPRLPDRPHSYDDQIPQTDTICSMNEPYTSGQHTQSMPTLPQVEIEPYSNRARPQTQQHTQVPRRKAVSPAPYREDSDGRYPHEAGGRRLSGVPFSPDAYDVLNPASSPTTNENTPFETPEQARFSSRMREARSADDMGPIIDNDGREIDPSDHLPTSSWAPEPERKQRKPEHVVHYRTKNDSHSHTTPGSSPASLRMNVRRSHPSTPVTNSPISAPSSSSRTGQYRPAPSSTRPLPNQPFPHNRNEPGATPAANGRQSHQRNSYYEGLSTMHRPSLSEYQVPVHSTYVPAGSAYPTFHTTTTPAVSTARCSQNYDDPLAAELSMIDIGPSRGLRNGLRMSRGY